MALQITIPDRDQASFIASFWSQVQIGNANECWPWTSGHDYKGYGYIYLTGKIRRAHRVAYLLSYGQQPGEMVIHTCDNPPCCNPAHLRSGTAIDNVHDMIAKGRWRPTINNRKLGSENINAKLTADDIPRIKEMRARGMLLRDIGKQFGVSRFAISKIMRGITWRQQ